MLKRECGVLYTIPKMHINGEWCENEGRDSVNYHVFRRKCGNAYYLSDIQLYKLLNELIFA